MARFFRRGKSVIYFLPVVAAYSGASGVGVGSPTNTEISSGTNLSTGISAITGFDLTNTPIPVPDLASIFQKNIPGEDSTAASSLTFYDDDASTTFRTALAKGTSGYIVLMPYGKVTSKRCETWPITTTGVNDTWDTGNDAARFVVSFSVTDVPSITGTLP